MVSQGGSGTYGVGWICRHSRVPDGLPDRSPDAARNATGATFARKARKAADMLFVGDKESTRAPKIFKPNRFAYPFRSRPGGVCGSPILNLRPAKTPSYRDTANLGLGVTPRPLPISPPCVFAGNPIFKLRTVPEAPLRQRVASREPAKEHVALLGRERTLQVPFAS